MRRYEAPLLDLRAGEARPVLESFAALFLLIGAHTMLETARDALFLSRLPPQQLTVVYIAVAGLSFFAVAGSTRLAARFGRRNALIGTLCLVSAATMLLHAAPLTPRLVMTLYVVSGLAGAVLAPQFWLLAAQRFTSAQARRLFGPVASGGVVGGVAGAASAGVLLSMLPVTSLLLASSFAFLATALLLTTLGLPPQDDDVARRLATLDPATTARPSLSLAQQPFVWRVALLVGLSTAAVLTVDYLFKSTAARAIPAEELGPFFARYYAIVNGVALVVQLFIAGHVVRKFGVAATAGVMPTLLLGGGIGALLTGGALVPVLAMRLIDGGMRHSLNRVAIELLYLPMPAAVRERAKGLIDTFLARSVQATTASALFVLGTLGVLSSRLLAAVVIALCAAWATVALGLRRPYLDVFRAAIARGALQLGAAGEGSELDVNAAELLVEAMASPEPTHVVAALDVLEQRHRAKLIPALILYHDAEVVLLRALEIFGASTRDDWRPLGERLLRGHPSAPVRIAAVRALARHGVASALVRAADDASSAVRGYAAYHVALGSPGADLAQDPRLVELVEARGEHGDAGRRVLLTAIGDSPDPRASSLVLALAQSPAMKRTDEDLTLVARAMEALGDPRHVPFCVAQLAFRPGRDAIRRALVAMGAPAHDALEAALEDPKTDRRVRTHIPWTLAELGTQRAADDLMARLERESDGFVRYKVLRALGHLVATHDVVLDRARIERQVRRTLVEHLRVTALRVVIEGGHPGGEAPSPAFELLVGILQNKQSQSLERAFRLLKIAHKQEDIHRVHAAATSGDRALRSHAGEFLDALLAGRGQRELRALFRLVVEDLTPAERVARARAHLGPVPAGRDEALASLIADHDEGVATLASNYALSIGAGNLRATIARARRDRPSLDSLMERCTIGSPRTGTAQ